MKFATKIPKINDSKLNMWSLSFTLRFFGRKSQSQQKLAEKIIHFTMQFDSFDELRTTQNCKIYTSQHN